MEDGPMADGRAIGAMEDGGNEGAGGAGRAGSLSSAGTGIFMVVVA